MRDPDEIKKLAYLRLDEAKILCDAGKYNGAFYLAGYSVELMLKAKVCEHLGIGDLFAGKECKVAGIGDIKNAVQTHDIGILLIFSGLRGRLADMSKDGIVMESYGLLLGVWSEKVRYQFVEQDAHKVKRLIELLSDKEKGLLAWIKKN